MDFTYEWQPVHGLERHEDRDIFLIKQRRAVMHAYMRCASQRSYRRGLVPTSPCTLNAALHRCPCRPPRHLANHVELFCVRAAVDNQPVLEMSASEAPTLYSIEKGCSACRSGLLSCLDHPHPRGRAPCATAAMHSIWPYLQAMEPAMEVLLLVYRMYVWCSCERTRDG